MKQSYKLVGAFVSAALLAACGGGSSVMTPNGPIEASSAKTPRGPIEASAERTFSQTFHYTGAVQRFKVPSGVTQVTITAKGAGGGAAGGRGASVTATIPIPLTGRTLTVVVGGEGNDNGGGCCGNGGPGFNG
ncbi:MAG: hypothetical protein WBE35_04795, partial [Candidatus Cybelea sp.]